MVEALGPNSHDGMPSNVEGDLGYDHQYTELQNLTNKDVAEQKLFHYAFLF